MRIQHYLFTFLFVLAFPVLAEEKQAPNIILILADDLGWGDLACYGHPEIKTPNIDRLAKNGVLFTNAYAGAPVCSPTRAGIMTGRNPGEIGIHGHMGTEEQNRRRGMPQWLPLPDELSNIAAFLSKSGYATAHFGKWHLGGPWQKDAPIPLEYGYKAAVTFVSTGQQLAKHTAHGNGKHPETEYSKAIVDLSLKFLNEHPDQPVFLNLWFHVPHTVLIPTKEMMAAYPQLVPFGPELNEAFRQQYQVDEFSTPKQVYYSMITDFDTELGRLFDELAKLGKLDNTLIVFTSDNGPEVGEWPLSRHSSAGSPGPFRGMKRSLYEGGIRVPFIASWPAKQLFKNRIDRTTLVTLTDLPATFAAAAGKKWAGSESDDSENILPAIEGYPLKRQSPLYWSYREPMAGHPSNFSPMGAIREGKWKLLANQDGSRLELYNMETDPGEHDNLSIEHPQVAEQMLGQLQTWLQSLPGQDKIPVNSGSNQHPWSKLLP